MDSEGGKYTVQLLMVPFRELTLINHPQRLQECSALREKLARLGEEEEEGEEAEAERRREVGGTTDRWVFRCLCNAVQCVVLSVIKI